MMHIRGGHGAGFGADPDSGYIFSDSESDADLSFRKKIRIQIRYVWYGLMVHRECKVHVYK